MTEFSCLGEFILQHLDSTEASECKKKINIRAWHVCARPALSFPLDAVATTQTRHKFCDQSTIRWRSSVVVLQYAQQGAAYSVWAVQREGPTHELQEHMKEWFNIKQQSATNSDRHALHVFKKSCFYSFCLYSWLNEICLFEFWFIWWD